QLVRITVTNSWKSEFTYDGNFRRRIRKEFAWRGSDWSPTNEVHYLYDGSVVIQERDTNNLPKVTYTVGGQMLARSDMSGVAASPTYYHADGNANITCLINTNQLIAAKYLYGPFGNILSMRGSVA